jgi:hypothetical protein
MPQNKVRKLESEDVLLADTREKTGNKDFTNNQTLLIYSLAPLNLPLSCLSLEIPQSNVEDAKFSFNVLSIVKWSENVLKPGVLNYYNAYIVDKMYISWLVLRDLISPAAREEIEKKYGINAK